ncbi:SufB/SufD family protein [Ruminococcus sp.]|uniref:SufB/SufD family protein n=1 Tax=Ruminococcus sp. TaxID=41978 RepID=UPI002E77D099|nr:SufD family Fe-S cluster assembly protein [Ruminococcus sp.]MEE1264115.1 SufD family Fe-S cluster assembly protein [Ruminococcus sp.]
MLGLDDISKMILNEVADITDEPDGAYNFRVNSQLAGRNTTENINIVSKENGSGIDIFIKPGTKGENLHIPVVINESGVKETVYNDFFIGDNCDVTIVAGCGIDNCGAHDSQHDGVHRFYVGKNSRIKYVEKHFGSGSGDGKRILNPVTEVYMEENGVMEMEMEQIKGVDSTNRMTIAELKAGAKLLIKERLMTHGEQTAVSGYKVSLNGEGSTADVVSRSVARDTSSQTFNACISGNAPCSGHTECDSIIMDSGKILAIPSLEANDVDAMLVHEAAIGKIAGDQLIKLMTLGLTEAEAEQQIINGFLS